ncbi:MAG TPA: TIGR01777 family oxidoreductase [Anaeromyxobacteraceae bacterium]
MRVFVTGATGLLGRPLCAALRRQGHAVVALSRARRPDLPEGVEAVQGDPTGPGAWQEALAGCDACVSLAGEPLAAGRWTADRKRRIRESRLLATRNVAAAVAAGGPRVLVSASAVGYYGDRGDELLTESSAPGAGFLPDLAQEWEAEAGRAAGRARVVLLRTGVALAREGGALPRLVLPFRLFAGGPIGDGAFWQPWIHVVDAVGLACWALGDERVAGPLNAAAPEPVRNRELARALGRALRRPSRLPAPAFAVRLAVGEMAEAVTASLRVVPRKALDLGYAFRFTQVDAALADLL